MLFFRRKKKFNYHFIKTNKLSFNRGKKRQSPLTWKVKKNKGKKLKISILLLTILIITGAFFAIFSDYFLIEKTTATEINDDNIVPPDIEAAINAIKKQNLLFIDTESIIQEILKNHQEISEINIKKIFPNELTFEIVYFPRLLNFIISDTPSKIEHRMIINSEGTITSSNKEDPSIPYFYLTSLDNEDFEAIFSDNLRFNKIYLNNAIKAPILFEKTFNIKTTEKYYFKLEKELHFKTEKGFFVWIDLEKDIEKQIDKLHKALLTLDIHKEPLSYIDLRINSQNGDKVIFKRK